MKTGDQQFIQIRGGGGFVAVKTRLLVEISPEPAGGCAPARRGF